jgi:hypothetical protein
MEGETEGVQKQKQGKMVKPEKQENEDSDCQGLSAEKDPEGGKPQESEECQGRGQEKETLDPEGVEGEGSHQNSPKS